MLFGILKDGRFEYGLKGRNKKEFNAIFGSVPRIKEAIERNEPIFIPEGEKDVNTLVKKGYTAFSCGGLMIGIRTYQNCVRVLKCHSG
mgnify:FL=1